MNYAFLKEFSYNLFTRTLLLFHISLNILLILLGAAIPVTLTKNQVKAIYLNSSGKGFLPLKLPTRKIGAIALSYPPRVRIRATVKLSAAFLHDESSITKGGYESAIASKNLQDKSCVQKSLPTRQTQPEKNLAYLTDSDISNAC